MRRHPHDRLEIDMPTASQVPGEVHSGGPVKPSTPIPATAALAGAGELLRALAAPVRIAIVAQPLISQHLRVLKAAGVVQGERHGREVVYRLVDDHLAHIVVDAVAHVQEDA
jgi:hypothetical protein